MVRGSCRRQTGVRQLTVLILSVVIGIIQGILPPVLLAVLFMLLPIVLRKMVVFEGKVRKSEVELELFTRFWLFQVIHGFLIMTIAGGLMNALKNIDKTLPELPTILATELPKSSTFFLTVCGKASRRLSSGFASRSLTGLFHFPVARSLCLHLVRTLRLSGRPIRHEPFGLHSLGSDAAEDLGIQ